MIKHVIGVTTFAAIAAASPAAAQYASDGSSESWEGAYVGLFAGANKTEADGGYIGIYPGLPTPTPTPTPGPTPTPTPTPGPTPTPTPTPGPSPTPTPGAVTSGSAESISALNVGVLGGYDWQMGRFVLGVAGDLSYQSTGEDLEFSQIAGTEVKDTLTVDWRAHALARYGYDFNGTLLYLTGGAAFANIEASHVGYTSPTQTFEWQETDWRLGYTYGAGLETQFGEGWALRAEYLYDYWDAERYDWVPNQRYSDIAVTIDEVRIAISKRY